MKGDMVVREQEGVIMGKWKDKRDVTFLSTVSVPVLEEIPRKNLKPSTVIQYLPTVE